MREPLRNPERLKHMMEAINYIESAAEDLTLEKLSNCPTIRHALSWNVMIIGEAANKLTKEFCEAHPVTPWRKIAGMRHVLVHDYYQIDVVELWEVINSDIPILKNQIQQYLAECSES